MFQVGLGPAPRVVGKLNASPINALRWRAIGGADRENSQKQPDNSQTRRSAVKRLIILRKNLAARAACGPRACPKTLGACPRNAKKELQPQHIVLRIDDVYLLLYATAKYSIIRTGS